MPLVQAYLYAMLRRYQPHLRHGESAQVQLVEGGTVADLLRILGIPEDETKQTFVNGIARGADWVLQDGDRVAVFPPIAGG